MNDMKRLREAALEITERWGGVSETDKRHELLLARAFLAMHPEDGELPVDEDWLREEWGFEEEGGKLWVNHGRWWVAKHAASGGWCIGQYGTACLFADFVTQKQFRALAKCLGLVPVKGGENGRH